ncbi:MAG: hypothetical protein OXF29_08880 [Hyphomicrobiales bacterium]|nr:hypothetical protein [Hyphomicrobiales bacterium]
MERLEARLGGMRADTRKQPGYPLVQAPPPEEGFSETVRQWHKRVLEVRGEILYVGDKDAGN